MMSTFVAEIKVNKATVDYTPGSATAAGVVVVAGSLIGVVVSDLAAAEKGALCIEGVIEIPKPTGAGTDYSRGDPIYWDAADTNGQDTADSGTNKRIGTLLEDRATTDTHMQIWWQQF
jgi:predicted RecA/RadA family phage recombinase